MRKLHAATLIAVALFAGIANFGPLESAGQQVGPAEAALVFGSGCSGQGNQVTVCTNFFCNTGGKWHNNGNQPNGNGQLGSSGLSCPCDPGGGTTTVVSGSCNGE